MQFLIPEQGSMDKDFFFRLVFKLLPFFVYYFCSVKPGNTHFIAKSLIKKKQVIQKGNIMVYLIKHSKTLNLT